MSFQLELKLPAEPTAAAMARHSVNGLGNLVAPPTLENVELLVSELVSNSIRHAGLGDDGWIRLKLSASRETLRAEVIDPGPGFSPPEHPVPRQDDPSGWGLYFLDRLATRWGVHRNSFTHVWFEIDRPFSTLGSS